MTHPTPRTDARKGRQVKKPSQILREAARITERTGRCGCGAILEVLNDGDGGLNFVSVLKHFKCVAPSAKSDSGEFWWLWPGENDARIIGLCLAAAIAESEGN